jgi:transposase
MKWYLGIDVSKGYADFALFSEDLQPVEEVFQLDDTKQGHDQLVHWFGKLFKRHPELQIDCGVESTGGYENNWYALLLKLGSRMPIRAVRLNPSVVKNASKALLNANKTDAESAREIAGYLKRYADQVTYTTEESAYVGYRSLYNHLDKVRRQKTEMINELKQLLYSNFPELERFAKSGVPAWVLDLLMRYPTSAKLRRAKAVHLAKIKGLTVERAQLLIAKAKASVASHDSPADEFVIIELARDIKQKQEKLDRLKAYLADNCKGPETALLASIKGIGAYSAAAIMIQIEDIRRFASPKQLASYFGLHPILRVSGDKQMVSRMSKQGRSAVRGVLYMCANSAILSDPHLHRTYARQRALGKAHNQAIGVIMHKMLRIIWGVLTNGKPYDPEIDRKNQERSPQAPAAEEIREVEKKRRMQGYDESAPVSRTAAKKRRAHALSQAGDAGQVRDLVHGPG